MPFTVDDFMPKTRAQIRRLDRAERKASQQILAAHLKAVAAAHAEKGAEQ